MKKQWKTLFRQLNRYRVAYGGITNMLRSPFLGVAFVLAAVNYSQWVTPTWPTRTEALIPSLLGFSLGTYAILFSIMSSRLKGALRAVPVEAGGKTSWLDSINATFFHFIFVQVLALMWSFAFQGTWFTDAATLIGMDNYLVATIYKILSMLGSFIGLFLLNYSVLLMVASAIAIYRLALIRDPQEGKK